MPELALYGTNLWGEPHDEPKRPGKIAAEFLVPPFTVLSARDGWWQDRKRAWIGLGIKSEIGRGSNELGLSGGCEQYRTGKSNYARTFGQDLMRGEHVVGMEGNQDDNQSGTSIFDPTLCELAYRWFCPSSGQVVDPFAGGSVRGIVAACLGRRYWGCDLRAEQVAANEAQAAAICPGNPPIWVCGDSRLTLADSPAADFLFSCPPYGDLEIYSDDPRDLSVMTHDKFCEAYGAIVSAACERLKQDRFACFVVGDFRDKAGHYRDFVSATTAAFKAAGLRLYNEAILVTAVGSLPIRITKQFNGGRKLGKTHQNVLVFVKGDWKRAAAACETEARS